MKKRIICILVVAVLICALIPNTCLQVSAVTSGAGEKKFDGGRRDFQWPVPNNYGISGCFLDGRSHYAIDIPASKGTNVVASYPGTVHAIYTSCTHNYSKSKTCCNDGFGNYVVIKHSYTLSTGSTITLYSRYSHLTSVSVNKGDSVKAGGKIGTVGSTGYSQGNHLDFQILKGGWSNRAKYSLDPYINELLELPSKVYTASTSSCCGVGPNACCCYEYLKDVKAIYANNPYLNKCTPYPAYCTIEANASTSAMSLPCSSGTNSESEKLISIAKGEKFTATELILNDQGNHWYKIKTADGKTAYTPASKMDFVDDLLTDIKITSPKAPTTLKKGNAFSIEGTVKSTYNDLTKVGAYVYAGNKVSGDPVTGGAATVNGTSYSLKGSTVDSKVLFNELGTGTYTYAVYAYYKNYYAKDEKTSASNTGKVCVYTATFKVTSSSTSCSHSYSSKVTTKATCTKNGVKTFTCSKCNASYTETIAATGHAYGSWETIKYATCTVDGYKEKVCSNCGDVQTQTIAATGNHTYGTWYAVETESCTKDGYYERMCTGCSLKETKTVGSTGHSFESSVTPSTCTTNGYTVYTCQKCDYSYVGDFTDLLAHTPAIDKVVEATCTTSGKTEGKHCSVCNTVIIAQQSVPAKGHIDADTNFVCDICDVGLCTNHVEETIAGKASTCTVAGLTEGKKCVNCGEVTKAQQVIPANGHTEVVDKASVATCTSAGKTEGAHCKVCGIVLTAQQTIPAKGHTEVIDKAVTATCTVIGKTEGKHCSVCGKVLVAQQEIPLTEHAYADDQDATCDECGHVREDEHAHDYESVVTEPTCGEQGFTTHTCDCGESYVDDYVEPTGKHDFGFTVTDHCLRCDKTIQLDHEHDFVFTTCGDCWYFHTELFTCTICESTYSIPAPSGHYHPYTYEVTKAQTLTEAGVVTITCQNCVDTYTLEIPAGKDTIVTEECGDNVRWTYNIDTGVLTISGEGSMEFESKSCGKLSSRKIVPWAPFAGDVKEVVIEDGITSIDYRAFCEFKQVKDLTIPGSVTSIDHYVFSECDTLETVVFEGDVPSISEYAFKGTTVTAYYPAGNATWTEENLQNYNGTITWVTSGIDCEHVEVLLPGKEPTCLEAGLTDGKICSKCEMVLVARQTIPAKGHSFDHAFDYKCDSCGVERIVDMTRPMVDMFRMYNPNTGEHFYTGSTEERDNLVAVGWQYEGVGFTFPLTTGKPVYRLFQPSTGEHLYTMDEEEKAKLMAEGWNYEGIAFNSGFENEVPQFRLHNPNATVGAYHFTASTEERDTLLAAGWEYKGIGWYSLGA